MIIYKTQPITIEAFFKTLRKDIKEIQHKIDQNPSRAEILALEKDLHDMEDSIQTFRDEHETTFIEELLTPMEEAIEDFLNWVQIHKYS